MIYPVDEYNYVAPVEGHSPVKIVGNYYVVRSICERTIQQAKNCAVAPGVERVILNPDAHAGYGAPIGSVLVTDDVIYPGPVGVDIKCSMSYLQTNIPAEEIEDLPKRRELIDALCDRVSTGAGYARAKHGRSIDPVDGLRACCQGASESVCRSLGIPPHWANCCEDRQHGEEWELFGLLDQIGKNIPRLPRKMDQLGSLGGGNHFCEGAITNVVDSPVANRFGLLDGCLGFLTHCGSRGIGHWLATQQFHRLQEFFKSWRIPFPGDDKELVYAPVDSPQGREYLNYMAIGANFATVNHLLINQLVSEAVASVFPDAESRFVYFISHNIVRHEARGSQGKKWVHRKGATRAYPAFHHELKGGPFYETGHPILLPGDPMRGSAIMVASQGAGENEFSVNHGSGRQIGRKQARRELNQAVVDQGLRYSDVIHNNREFPLDEAPAVYKDFNEVIDSVVGADLATKVANLDAKLVVKGS